MARRVPPGGYAVNVNGLDELVRAFRKMDRETARAVQRRLREAADVVAEEAKSVAEAQGLHRTGRLVRSIRPFYSGTTAGVRAGATNRGYPYPARYEYGGRGTGEGVGPRAFLAPALERKRDEVEQRLEQMIDDVADAGGF